MAALCTDTDTVSISATAVKLSDFKFAAYEFPGYVHTWSTRTSPPVLTAPRVISYVFGRPTIPRSYLYCVLQNVSQASATITALTFRTCLLMDLLFMDDRIPDEGIRLRQPLLSAFNAAEKFQSEHCNSWETYTKLSDFYDKYDGLWSRRALSPEAIREGFAGFEHWLDRDARLREAEAVVEELWLVFDEARVFAKEWIGQNPQLKETWCYSGQRPWEQS